MRNRKEKRDNNEKKGEGISYPFPRKKNRGGGGE